MVASYLLEVFQAYFSLVLNLNSILVRDRANPFQLSSVCRWHFEIAHFLSADLPGEQQIHTSEHIYNYQSCRGHVQIQQDAPEHACVCASLALLTSSVAFPCLQPPLVIVPIVPRQPQIHLTLLLVTRPVTWS